MGQPQAIHTATFAVYNTGPLISTFQSDSFSLLAQIFAEIHISTACVAELVRHGWEAEVKASTPPLVIVSLSAEEQQQALVIAAEIAQQPETNDPVVVNHLGEAQAIRLALRPEHQQDMLLLDELGARKIARQRNMKLSGFPGVLLMAVQAGLLSVEELRERLESCRQQGTHYSVPFIRQVYKMAKQKQRE
jgi:predicted nucleic acid-binding protein